MRKRLILLSDLWGLEKAEWTNYYVDKLRNSFDVCCYDCCKLGNVATTNYSESVIHAQFLDGGVDKAVDSLVELELTPILLVGFSIGGLIGWKAALKGLNVLKLYAISSTRLRFEFEMPKTDVDVYFGESDPNRPSKEWFDMMQLKSRLEPSENHQFYCKQHFAQKLIKLLDEEH